MICCNYNRVVFPAREDVTYLFSQCHTIRERTHEQAKASSSAATHLVLGGVIRVDGVGLVDAEHEAPLHGAVVEVGAAGVQRVADAPDRLADDGAPGPRRGRAPDCAKATSAI